MDTKNEFLPFHAINEFMRPDFRLTIVRDTLSNLDSISDNHRNAINRVTRKYVNVPGFRNSEKAPVLVKVLPVAKAFEQSSELVSALLAAWAEVHAELRSQVYQILSLRNWKMINPMESINFATLSSEILQDWPVLPIDADRTKLPGFNGVWPKGEDFEVIYNHHNEVYPASDASIDQVSLMAVWLSLRLPLHVNEGDSTPSEN